MQDKHKERAVRLIDYLTALGRINSKIVRSIEDYKNVLWVHTVPHEPKHCFCQAWGEEDEHGDDVWIEVRKMREPRVPPVPNVCKDWVDFRTLRETAEIPELRQTIQVECEKPDAESGETISTTKILSLGVCRST
jgi:hypothetical protein